MCQVVLVELVLWLLLRLILWLLPLFIFPRQSWVSPRSVRVSYGHCGCTKPVLLYPHGLYPHAIRSRSRCLHGICSHTILGGAFAAVLVPVLPVSLRVAAANTGHVFPRAVATAAPILLLPFPAVVFAPLPAVLAIVHEFKAQNVQKKE